MHSYVINVASILNTVGVNCCANLDMQLTVECVDGLAMLKWNIQKIPMTTFSLKYECNSNASCYEFDGEEVAIMMFVTFHAQFTFIYTEVEKALAL